MKANIEDHKRKLAIESEKIFPHLMANYTQGDFKSLGKLCDSLNVLAEFYQDNSDGQEAKRVPRLMDYLDDKFKNAIVLILKNGDKFYRYTSNNITKFIRGEFLHGASENLDAKRKTLHEFIFEKDTTIECEFQVSWNWIAGPNLRADTGNVDSGGPFIHAVKFNQNRIEVSVVEAIILSIAYQFWQANTNALPKESTKVFVKFNPMWYENLWGTELATTLKDQLENYYSLTMPETDS